MLSQHTRGLCRLFAGIAEYPDDRTAGFVEACSEELQDHFPGAAAPMRSFAAAAQCKPVKSLQEAYIQAFDLSQSTTLFLGYHLFGDNPKRSAFLARLADAYAAAGLDCRGELADHLSLMLQFLSLADDRDFTAPLVTECMIPMLEVVERELEKEKAEYSLVINSLRLFLAAISQELVRQESIK